MAAETTTSPALQCNWCGSVYRRSYFDRQCSCPACGRNLQSGLGNAPSRRSARYVLPAVVLIGAVGLSGFVLKSIRRPALRVTPSEATQPVDAPPPFIPTARFVEAIAMKAQLLEQDLALSPDEPFLIGSLAETYLYRAMAEYQLQESRTKAQPWLRRSKAYVERLHRREPFASYRLRDVVQHFPNVRFNSLGWPSITTSLWRLQAGRLSLFAAPAPGGVPFIRRRRDVTGLPPTGDIPMGGPGNGPGPFPGPPSSGGPGAPLFGDRPPSPAPIPSGYPGSWALRMPGNGPYSNAPVIGGPGTPRVVEPGVEDPETELRLAALRRHHAEQPADLIRADRLASELLRASANFQPALAQSETQTRSRQRIEEAAEIYTDAAQSARLHVHRAAFYASAADARRRLEQWEQQYELLQRAAENAPFAPAVWHELKTAALRLGKLDESMAASKNQERWQFPGIEKVRASTQ